MATITACASTSVPSPKGPTGPGRWSQAHDVPSGEDLGAELVACRRARSVSCAPETPSGNPR